MSKNSVQVATVILAGGEGTRLHPLTLHHSKPAVSYGGRYRLIDIPISNSIHSDLRQIFVIAQYLSGELQHHISQSYHFDAFNPGSVDVLTPQIGSDGSKDWFEGTADAVRKNLDTLLKSSADYFLILSGDQLYNMNFQSMIAFAVAKKAELTIACLPIHKKEAKRMGLLKIDAHHKVIDFAEKPQEDALLDKFELSESFFHQSQIQKPKEACYLGSMGIYIFKRDALISLLKNDPRNDFGHHLISTAVKKEKTFAYVFHGYWEDIGTVASYYEANLLLTNSNKGLNTSDELHPIYTRPSFLPGPKIKSCQITESILCEGSIIEATEIHHCIIGMRSHIKKGTILRDTVMMGNHFYMPPADQGKARQHQDFWIGENCLIERAIIDEHVQIGNNVKLINKNRHEKYEGEGVFVRDGIIIVPAGTRIPDNFIF